MKISLQVAVQKIENGEVIAVPTDTVYGLVAKKGAASKIYALKGRPPSKPLILFIASKDAIPFIPEVAEKLIAAFWPGPLTVVIKEISYRIPNHPNLLALLKKTGPLVSTSANLSGKPPALLPNEVEGQFGMDIPVLEGDPSIKDAVSTIVSFQNQTWTILREGAISKEKIQRELQWVAS